MANRVSSSINSKTKDQNISLSNNHSTYTTNTTHNISSSNVLSTDSMNRHSREYEPSYPSITRYRTSSSSSPYRRTHYLDDFIEEIIHEEILEITYLDHYPTLLERWGNDAKAIIKYEGEFIIEDYIEFEEIEPTITEEISYEIIYLNNEIKSTREVHHTHSETRNFRKIKKRCIKRRHKIDDIHIDDIDRRATQLLNNMHNLQSKIDSIIQTGSNDLSGDNYELTNIDETIENSNANNFKEIYPTNSTINIGDDRTNVNIIANETSLSRNEQILLQSLKSHEQQKDLSNNIKQEYQNDLIPQRIEDKDDAEQAHPSCSILTNKNHISSDDHEIISTTKSSINESNEENKQTPDSKLQSTISKVDQPQIRIKQEKTITQENASGHDDIQSIKNQPTTTITETSHQSLTTQEQIILPSIDTKSISSIENDNQSSIIAIEHNFNDDLLSFLKSLLSHLIPNTFEENNQSLISQSKSTEESLSNIDSQTNQNIPIDKHQDFEIETFQPNTKFEELKTFDKPLTHSHINHENLIKSNEIEQLSSKVVTEEDSKPLTIPINLQSLSDNVKKNLTDEQENIHDDISTQNPKSTNIVLDKQKTMFEDLQLSIEEERKDNELEHYSSTNQTIDSFEQKVDKPSIDSLTEIVQQIKTIPLTKVSKIPCDPIQNLHEDKNQSKSNLILSTTEIIHEPFDEIEQTYGKETPISSNDSATLVISHQPSDEIKTDIITHTTEKTNATLQTNLNIEVDKQPKAISIPQLTTTSEIQQIYANENENIELSSDFLADIVRQIETTASTTHFPLVDHTPQVIEKSTNDFINKTTEQSCNTSIPITNIEDNKPLELTKNLSITKNVHETNFDNEAKYISSNVIDDILIKSPLDDNTKINLISKDIKSSSESLIEIVRQILSSPIQSISHIDSSTSSITDLNTEKNFQSSIQNNISNESELLTTSIIPELLNSTYQDKSLDDIDKKSISSPISIKSNDINSINQFTTDISYSITELTNVMNDILNFSMKMSDENPMNISQQSNISEQITSTKSSIPETDFNQQKYFSIPNSEQISLDLTSSINNEQLDKTKTTSDLTKIYYELKEQRHIQPVHIYEQKQEILNDNLNNHIQHIDLTSFSQISNLPSREYHQVFGTSDEIVDTINDLTKSIDQTFQSNISDEVKPITFDSDSKSQISEIFEDNQSIVSTNQEQIINENIPNIISNVEFDFRYSSLLNQLDTLMKPLHNLSSSLFNTEHESLLSKTHEEKDNLRYLNERYDVLIDHVNHLDEATHASPIIKTTDIDKQVSTLSSNDQFIDLVQKRPSPHDQTSATMPQYQSTTTEIISSPTTIASTDTFKDLIADSSNETTTTMLSNTLTNQSNIASNQPTVHYDDYPSYSNSDTIADAEKKLGQLSEQLNIVNEQNYSPTIVEFHEKHTTNDNELQNKEKTVPSTIITMKPLVSSDIDLEPVIHHGHPTTSTTTSPTVLQTTNVPSKTKHKKKKKEKSEAIFFDAPQLISYDVNKQKTDTMQSELIEPERSINIKTRDSSEVNQTTKQELEKLHPVSTVVSDEQQQPEMLSTLITSPVNELKPSADIKDELISNDVSLLSSTLATIPSEQIKMNIETSKQQPIDTEPILQSLPSSIATISKIQQTSTDDHIQQDHNASQPSSEALQILYDDYPWYASYYTIADAETKIARLNEQLNILNENNRSPITIEVHETLSIQDNVSQNEPDNDDDVEDFHVVHRRKRIPSSTTTHTQTSSSTIVTTKPSVSSDIDLEPIILHGHPSVPIITAPIVSQTTNIPGKTKHKKKKKEKGETFFFDAPELISADMNRQKEDATQSELVKQEHPVNIATTDFSQADQAITGEHEQIQPTSTEVSNEKQQQEVLSALITSNIDELKRITDRENEVISNEVMPSLSTPLSKLSENVKFNTQSIEQESIDKESIPQSLPSSTTTTLSSNHQTLTHDHKKQDECVNDPSSHKFQVLNDDYPWYSSYYTIADAEAKIDRLNKQSNFVNEENHSSTTLEFHETPTTQDNVSQNEQDKDDDNEGFHIVHHRKRIPSSSTHTKTIQSAIITSKPSINSDIDLEPVILHGHPSAPVVASSIAPQSTSIPSKTKQKKKKKEKGETILFDAPELISPDVNKQKVDTVQPELVEQERPVNIETTGLFETSQPIKHEQEQLQPTSTEGSNKQQQPEVLPTLITSTTDELKQIADKNNELTSSNVSELSSNLAKVLPDEVKVDTHSIEQQPIDKEVVLQSSPTSTTVTTATHAKLISQSTVGEEEDDNEGFQVVHQRKHTPSAPRSRKPQQSSSTTNTIDGQNISPDIDLKPVIIHGRHDSASRSIPRTSSITETASTSTGHSAKSNDQVSTSNVANNEVVISMASDGIRTQTEAVDQEQSSSLVSTVVDYGTLRETDGTHASTSNVPISESTEETTHFVNTSPSVVEPVLSQVTKSQEELNSTTESPIITSEEIQSSEDDQQQQKASTGLFDTMTELLSSTLSSNTSNETSSETIQSVVKAQQPEGTTEEFVDANESSSVFTNDHQQDYTTIDGSKTSEEGHHGIFDLVATAISNVKETISNLASSDEKSVQIESSSNLSDKSMISAQPSDNLNDNKEQQTFIESVKDVIDKIHDMIIPSQKQVTRIEEQSSISNYPSHPNQFQATGIEHDPLFSSHQTLIDDHSQQDVLTNEPSHAKLHVFYDDYPWYSSHYMIADAETRITRLFTQLNFVHEQNRSPTTVEVHETQQEKDQDDDNEDFHVVQHRKRIPSSTIHTKTSSSTIVTTKSPVSPDIDLEPVVLHGHPSAPTTTSPIVSQSTNVPSKTKHKKKKKEKGETILFDAPELVLTDINKQKIDATQSKPTAQEYQVNIETIDSSEINQPIKREHEQLQTMSPAISIEQQQQQPNVFSTMIASKTEELKPIISNENQMTDTNLTETLPTPLTKFLQEVKVDTQSIEQQPIDIEPIPQSSLSAITTTGTSTDTKVLSPLAKEKEEDDDNEGFQVVYHRKHTPSASRSRKPQQTSSTANTIDGQNISSDIDLKPVIIHGRHDSASRSIPRTSSITETTSTSTSQSPKLNDKVVTSNVANNEVVISRPSEEIVTEVEAVHQQQPSLTGLSEMMKDVLSSTIQTKPIPTSNQVGYATSFETDDIPTLSTNLSTSEPTEKGSNFVNTKSLIEQQSPSQFTTSIKDVAATTEPTMTISDEIKINEKGEDDVDEGFHVVHRRKRIPSSTTHTQTSSSTIVTTKPSVSSDIDLEPSPTTNETEHDGVFSRVIQALSHVTETISNLGSSDEKTASPQSSSNLTDKFLDNTQQLNDLHNDKGKETFIENIKDIIHSIHEKILPTQEQETRIEKQTLITNYPTDAESARISSSHELSTDDHKQQDTFVNEPSCEKLQVLYDDYPWYSSYYTITDAETRITRLFPPLNFVNEQNRSSTTVETHDTLSTYEGELQNEKDEDDDDESFHVVHRRKRIPSSTTHTNTLPSTIITMKPPLSSDIDLEPVILHGHPSVPVVISPIASQTTNVTSKTKHKKKKKDKVEMIFFDAPELMSSDANTQKVDTVDSQLIEQGHPVNIETRKSSEINQNITSEREQFVIHSIHEKIVPTQEQETRIEKQTLITNYPTDAESACISSSHELSTDDHKQQDTFVNEPSYEKLQVLYDDYPWYSSYYTITDAETRITRLFPPLNFVDEQNRSSTAVETHETLSTYEGELQNEKYEDDDDESFHVVHRRKRIPSSTTHTKTLPSTIITMKPPLNSDIDLEPVILHGHPSVPVVISPIASQATNVTSKTKHKKKKKDKVEMIFFDAPELLSSDANKQKVDTVDSQLIEQGHPVNIETRKSSEINQNITSEREQVESTSTEGSKEEQEQTEVISTSITTNTGELTQTTDQGNEITSHDNSQLLSTPVKILPEEVEVDTQSIGQQSVDKESILQLSPSSITTSISTVQQAPSDDHKKQDEFVSKSSIEKLQVLNDDYPWYSSYYTIADAETTIAQQNQRLNLFNEQKQSPTTVEVHETLLIHEHELQNEKEEDNDDEGFHVVHRRKRTPSSTTHTKTSSSTIVTMKPPVTPDIDLEPVILHGHPFAPTITSSIASQPTNIPSNTKYKKKKKEKGETILFDAPELTSSDRNKHGADATQSKLVKQELPVNIETIDSSQINQPLQHQCEQLHQASTVTSKEQESEVLSTLTTSNIDELNPVTDKENEMISKDVMQSLSTSLANLSDGHESQNEKDKDDDDEGFHVVHRRKRIPSSSTQTKTVPSTFVTSKLSISSDIDLEPVILHGHPSAPVVSSPIASETRDTSSKTKHKKNKKEKAETILFDAPELTSSDRNKDETDTTQSKLAKQELPVNIETIDSSQINQTLKDQCEQLHQASTITSKEQEPEVLSTLITSNIDELNPVTDKETEVISKAVMQSLPTSLANLSDGHELQDEKDKDDDDDGFHVVHRRKRIPSSSTQTKTVPSTSVTSKLSISSDIDLEPIILHGHLSAPVVSSPIASEIKDTSSKAKHKKKKKDKSETILFDAPELLSSDLNKQQTVVGVKSELVEQERPVDIKTRDSSDTSQTVTHEREQLQPTSSEISKEQQPSNVLSTLIIPNTDELKQISDQENEVIHDNVTQLLSIPLTELSEEVKSDTQSIEQQPIDKELVLQSSPTSTTITTVTHPKVVSESTVGGEEEDDNEGFQVVNHRKHTPSTPRSRKAQQLSSAASTIDGQNISPDIDLKPVVIHGRHDSASRSVPRTTGISEITSTSTGKSVKSNDKALASSGTNNEILSSKPSEEIVAEVGAAHQQPSSVTGLSEIMKGVLSPVTQMKTAPSSSIEEQSPIIHGTIDEKTQSNLADSETSFETSSTSTLTSTPLVVQTTEQTADISQQQEDNVERFVDANNSSNVVSQSTSVPNDALQSDQNILSISNISTTNTAHQPEHETTNKSITTEEQHGIFDIVAQAISNVKEIISNLGSSDEKTATLQSLSNFSDKSITNTLESDNLDNDKEKQTFLESVKDIIHNIHENILPTQEQSLISNYSTNAHQFQSTIAEPDHLSSTQQISTDDNKQQNEFVSQSSTEKLQVLSDDYPWYSSYYTIVDAETKMGRLYEQLNLVHERNRSPIKVEFHEKFSVHDHELQNKKDEAVDDKIHIVEHHQCIPSSPTHTKTSASTIMTTELPVILHEHPTVPIITTPIVSQATNVPSKTKHKKKKKDKKETIVFDTPSLILSDSDKQKTDVAKPQLKEQERAVSIETIDSSQINKTIKHECEQLQRISTVISTEQKQPEVLTTLNISNTDKSKRKAEKKKKSTSNDDSKLLSTPVTIVSEEIKINTQTIKQQPIDKKAIVQSLPSPITVTKPTIRTKATPLPPEEEEEDNEGFQVVHYHKRILTATKSEKTSLPSTTTSKEIFSSDLTPKTSVIHEQKHLPTSPTDTTQSSTSKQKKNKHKKQKKEIVSSSSIDSTNPEQQTIHKEILIPSPILSSSLIEDSNIQSKPTTPSITKPTKTFTKTSPSSEEDDNDGFQVVHYRKHINSAMRSRQTPQSSSTTKTIYEHKISRNIDPRFVTIQEHHDSASRSIPRTTTTSKTPSEKEQKSSISTPLRSPSTKIQLSTSTNIDTTFETPKVIKQLESKPDEYQQQLKDSQYEIIPNIKPKSDQSFPVEQSIKPIIKEQHMSPKPEIKTINEKSSNDNIISSTVINTKKSRLIQDDDDDDGFQIVHHHKHKTSTIPKQSKFTSTIDQKSTNTYVKQDSFTLTTAKQTSKKFKNTNEHNLSSLITNNDFFPLAIEKTQNQTTNEHIQQVSPTSPINKHIHSTDNITKSNQELSTLSKKLPHKINDHLKTESIKSINHSQISSNDIISIPNSTINDEQNKIISNEKISKRRKKKLQNETKIDDKNLLTSSTSIIHTNIKFNDDKQQLNQKSTTIIPSIISIENYKSHEIKTDIPENISLTSSKIQTTELLTSPTLQSIHLIENQTSYEEANNKLDLFLPEYIREQINIHPVNSLSIDNTNFTSTTSSDIIQKKKSQYQMLKKDLETKTSLTNEFNNTNNINGQHESQFISSDSDNLNDDDEFIIQNFHSNLSNTSQQESTNNISTKQKIDDILSRGFHHWLQESEALSQQTDKSLSSHSLTQAMQSIVIQPIDSDDENSLNEFQTNKPTYIIGTRPEKRIHIYNGYSINHPESISTSSYFITQSNHKTFKDDSKKYDSDDEDKSKDDKTKKQYSYQIQTQSKQKLNSINDNNLQINFTNNDVQQNFYHQIDNNKHSINYDDWAYFLEHKNSSYHIEYDLSTSLECFYTQTFDDDTFLSNTIPIHYSIQHEKKKRYGDFLISNNDIIKPESIIKLSSYNSKPSESFQRWKKSKSISNQYQNDDEILISHSTNGLCRQVIP
ncbi:unnamed protein product [Rotaria sp. Silwood1]|nr:unnamed protein product [Rotaria sp. Silwood1]